MYYQQIDILKKMDKEDLFTKICKAELGVDVIKEHKFYEGREWRFDYAIPSNMLAIEVEGGAWSNGRHTRGSGFIKDMEKYNTATSMGWRLLRVIPDELLTSKTLELIKKTLKLKQWEQ